MEKYEGLAAKIALEQEVPAPRKWVEKFPSKSEGRVKEMVSAIEKAGDSDGPRR